MKSISTNESSPKKWIGVSDLLKNKAGIRIHRDIKFGEHTNELGEDVAALMKLVAENVSVDLLDLGEMGAAIERGDESRF